MANPKFQEELYAYTISGDALVRAAQSELGNIIPGRTITGGAVDDVEIFRALVMNVQSEAIPFANNWWAFGDDPKYIPLGEAVPDTEQRKIPELIFGYDKGSKRLCVSTQFLFKQKLTNEQVTLLNAYTQKQWKNGVGKRFAEKTIAIGGRRDVEMDYFIFAYHDKQRRNCHYHKVNPVVLSPIDNVEF